MKIRRILLAILLVIGFCFVSLASYGEVQSWMTERTVPFMDFKLLEARVDFIMSNPTNFTDIHMFYDRDGDIGKQILGEGFDTTGMIGIRVNDKREVFSDLSGTALKEEFKKRLDILYTFIKDIATDMNNDVVVGFYSKADILLGYFYEGEYYLWEE